MPTNHADMRVDDWLARAAEALPEPPALVAGERTLTFAELEREARATARRLAGAGGRARATAWRCVLEPTADYVVLLHALTKLGRGGGAARPARPGAGASTRCSGALGPTLVVRDPARCSRRPSAGRRARPATSTPTTSHCVIHTSGTGGRAEGRRADLRQPPLERDRRRRADRRRADGPLALLPAAAPHRRPVDRAALRALPDPDRARALRRRRAIAAAIERQGVTIVSLVPTMLARLLDAGAPLERLRCALIGGGPAAAGADRARARRRRAGGADLRADRGGLAGRDDAARRGARAARLAPARRSSRTEVRIDDEGRICVRGPSVAPGAAGEDGWLRHRRPRPPRRGRLPVRARPRRRRDRDRRRERVARARWSRCCSSTPPSPTPRCTAARTPSGSRRSWRTSCWRPAAASSEDDLRDFCRERLAPHKVPKAIAFVRRAAAQRPGQAASAANWTERRPVILPRLCPTSSTRTTPTSRSSRARPWPCSATARRATRTR